MSYDCLYNSTLTKRMKISVDNEPETLQYRSYYNCNKPIAPRMQLDITW